MALIVGTVSPGTEARAQTSVQFTVGSEVSAEDEGYVREGIFLAQRYGDAFGSGDSASDLFVNIRQTTYPPDPSVLGMASPGYINIYTGSRGWPMISAQRRIQVAVHEYFHAVEISWLLERLSAVPRWFIEGMTEYLSFDALVREGLLSASDVRGYYAWVAVGELSIPPLEDLEAYDDFYGTGGSYALAYLAIDHLLGGDPSTLLVPFLDAIESGQAWRPAFQDAFGWDADSFYRSFREARREMSAPRAVPDPFLEAEPVALESPVRIRSATPELVPGEQLVVSARSKPHTICVFSLNRETGRSIAVGTTFADGAGQLAWLMTVPQNLRAGPASVSADCGARVAQIEIAIIAADR